MSARRGLRLVVHLLTRCPPSTKETTWTATPTSTGRSRPVGARQQLSSTQRGLGTEHRKVRAKLLAQHIDGLPCPCLADGKCRAACPCRPAGRGLPMWRDAARNVDHLPLEADHGQLARSMGGTIADRLLLATCNRSRGAGTHQPMTSARPTWWSRVWY